MIGYILTVAQKEEIQGVFFADSIFFNCVQDISGTWFLFLSQQYIEILSQEFFIFSAATISAIWY